MVTDISVTPSTTAYRDGNIQTTLDQDGILVARIDMPVRAMNVFSLEMMDSLEHLLDHVEATQAVNGVVLASGKSTFLVGADLDMIRMFTEEARTGTHEALHLLCGRLSRLFRRLEKSAKPYVAAINGLALGGGLEITLACHERVIADDKSVQIGLPEIKLGLLPGAGGTQRLPRLIDAGEALRMLLTGEPVAPAKALQLGLVHEVVAPDQLIEAAKRHARALAEPRAPWDTPGRTFDAAPFDFSATDAFEKIGAFVGVSEQQRVRYPAYGAIMKCVTGGWNQPMDMAIHWEMDVFVGLIRNPVAGNMVRTLFLNRQRAAKEGLPPKSLSEARVAVVGENFETARALLEKGKAPLVDATAASGQDIVVITGGTHSGSGKSIAWLRDCAQPAALSAPVGAWLADPTEHGRAIELLAQSGHEELVDAGRKLAQWLRATPLVTTGRTGFLLALKDARDAARDDACSDDEVVLAVALAAAGAWLKDGIADIEIADVAAVLSGMHPAYTGGPFTYLRQTGLAGVASSAANAAQRHKRLFGLPVRLDKLFAALAAVER